MKKTVIMMISIFLGGCAVAPQEMLNKFNPTEYEKYREIGHGSITGQAFLTQNGGGVVTCAGHVVYLLPNTPYFQEALDDIKRHRKPKIDPNETATVVKKETCDAQGNFSFANISTGSWIVLTEVKWQVGYSNQGGAMAGEVYLDEINLNKKVILTTMLR